MCHFLAPCGATGNNARELHALAFVHVRDALLMHEALCLCSRQVKVQTSFRLIPVGIIRKYELACRVFFSRQLHVDCAAVRRHADTHHRREFPITVIPDEIRPAVVGGLAPVFPVRRIDVAVIFKQIFARNGGIQGLIRKFLGKDR